MPKHADTRRRFRKCRIRWTCRDWGGLASSTLHARDDLPASWVRFLHSSYICQILQSWTSHLQRVAYRVRRARALIGCDGHPDTTSHDPRPARQIDFGRTPVGNCSPRPLVVRWKPSSRTTQSLAWLFIASARCFVSSSKGVSSLVVRGGSPGILRQRFPDYQYTRRSSPLSVCAPFDSLPLHPQSSTESALADLCL
jgi:hypothetical protein